MDKKADLAGPGIGNYEELDKILPRDYRPLLSRRETQQAIFHVKRYIEDNLCKELSLMMVEVPLIVDVASGVNDMLDATDRAPQSNFMFRMTAISTPSMRRSCRQPRSGNARP